MLWCGAAWTAAAHGAKFGCKYGLDLTPASNCWKVVPDCDTLASKEEGTSPQACAAAQLQQPLQTPLPPQPQPQPQQPLQPSQTSQRPQVPRVRGSTSTTLFNAKVERLELGV